MTAKEQAIQDIKEELRIEGKSFLMFRKRLNPKMKTLEENYIKQQLKLSKHA